MTNNKKFIFSSAEASTEFTNCFNGVMKIGIYDVDQLMNAIADALRFPGYFGENWNALSDCLRDFSWIDQKIVCLTHQEIPKIDVEDLKIYLSVLQDAAVDWKDGEEHELIICFPASSENEIRPLLL